MSGSGRVIISLLKAEKSFQLQIKKECEEDKIKIRRLWIALLYFFQILLFSLTFNPSLSINIPLFTVPAESPELF